MRKRGKPRCATVLWVGLSEKPVKSGEVFSPLSPASTSGKLISEAESGCPAARFHKTNLVKTAPLDARGKLRYPTRTECEIHYPRLVDEIATLKPSLVLLLGKQVSTYVLESVGLAIPATAASFEYKVERDGALCYAAIHHPSYVAVYKRKVKDDYLRAIQRLVDESVP